VALGRFVVPGTAKFAILVDGQLMLAAAYGLVVGHAALFVALPAPETLAGIVAALLMSVAGLVRRAVRVLLASVPVVAVAASGRLVLALFALATAHVGSAFEAFRASALRAVEDDRAKSVVAARRAHGARVATLAANAGAVDGAVRISLAAQG